MKKLLFCFLIIIAFCKTMIAEEFVFTPLNVNFYGIAAKDNIVAAYGDFGSMLISYDNAATWSQKRVFDRGSIVKMFFSDDEMLAFSDIGEISISGDNGRSWQTKANLEDSILTVIKYPNGYFLRSRKRLMTLTNYYKPNAEFPLILKPFTSWWRNIKYRSSLAYFKGHLIAQADTSKHIRLDNNLIPVDTLYLKDFGFCETKCSNGYELSTDSNYLYTTSNRSVDSITKGINIYRTEDFTTFEKLYEGSNKFFKFKAIEDELYYIERHRTYGSTLLRIELHKVVMKDSSKFLAEFKYSKYYDRIVYTDFTIVNNKLILAGTDKFLATVDISSGKTVIISEFSGNSLSSLPDRINNTTYLFSAGDLKGRYENFVHITDDNGITIRSTVDYDANKKFREYSLMFRLKYYDKEENKLIFGGGIDAMGPVIRGGIYISSDYGENFEYKPMPTLTFNYNFPYPSLHNVYKNIRNGTYITADFNSYKNKYYSKIHTFDKDFDQVSRYVDSNLVIDYVSSTDTNSFLIHCQNTLDYTFEIKYTTDKGLNWEILKKYSDSVLFSYYKEIEIDNREKLAVFNYNDYNNVFTIDILDIEDRSINQIYENRLLDPFNDGNYRSHSISSDGGVVYIAAMDTIFYAKDIFDRGSWEYYVMPNNGRITRPFNRYGNRFYARYSDDIHSDNLYWIRAKSDPSTSVTQSATEVKSYLYSTPPYPLPATNEVRSFIYWDPSYDIDAGRISVYDIYGAKVSGRGDITIDKQSSYNGYLIWDCSGAVSGIYFIHIKHGTNSRTLMAIVSK